MWHWARFMIAVKFVVRSISGSIRVSSEGGTAGWGPFAWDLLALRAVTKRCAVRERGSFGKAARWLGGAVFVQRRERSGRARPPESSWRALVLPAPGLQSQLAWSTGSLCPRHRNLDCPEGLPVNQDIALAEAGGTF